MDPLIGTAKPKPPVGEFLLERRGKSRSRVTAEQKIMKEAVRLDGHRCRYPQCLYHGLPIDPAHVRGKHRGMGGNPALDRTTLETVFALCRTHHEDYDDSKFKAKPVQSHRGARGLMTFTKEVNGVKLLIGVN